MHYSGIGGQAVLEGVMMKNGDKYAVAVRKPDGEIDIQVEEYKGICADKKITKIPFIRGIFSFIDSLVLGMKVTMHSASFYEEDGEESEKKNGSKSDDIMMGITVAVSVIIAVALFMVLPFLLSDLLGKVVRNASLIAIFEGLIRILIFVAYIAGISLMEDIKRLYRYHGAEHKCINCIERGRPLNVKNVMRSSRQHKRCGTSFLLFVVLVSVIVFFFIRVDNIALKIVIRLLLVPVIAGISYELIRLAGRSNNVLVQVISRPGLWLQKLTTKEPDEDMIRVAIASVESVFDWKAYLREEFGYTNENLPESEEAES
ncbi:MAG: DUF1385 domain-containing protein [Lachnospiraceae bacterium]|nr:DUF1385 domain-containing protein [Lachnospiraceae bacterium]